MAKKLTPEDVFVPFEFPLEESNAYVSRGKSQEAIEEALNDGMIPVVFGGYGVGKTTLALKCSKNFNMSAKLIHIPNVHEMEFEGIVKLMLEELGYEVQVSKKKSSSESKMVQMEAEAGGGVPFSLTAKIKAVLSRGKTSGTEIVSELAVKSPTDKKLIQLADSKHVILIVDEMHRASESLVNDLSAFIKTVKNIGCKKIRVIILGTEADSTRLVLKDPGIDRFIQDVKVENMTIDELNRLYTDGFKRLKLNIGRPTIKHASELSVGSPYIAQYIGLESARNALKNNATEVKVENVTASIEKFAKTKAQRFVDQYVKAIETTGQLCPRKNILHAMASSENQFVTMKEIVEYISKVQGKEIKSTALSGPLRRLKNEFEILSDSKRRDGKTRAINLSSFKDPGMKSIIKLIESGKIKAVS